LLQARRFLVPGLIAGALIRVLVMPLLGTGDVDIWKVWTFSASYNPTSVYGVGGHPTERRILKWQGLEMVVDYPPVTIAELALVGRVYRSVHPLFEDSKTLNALIKLPGVAAETLAVVAILTLGRRRWGPEPSSWMALAFWLNPAVLIDGPILGYLDAQMAIPAAMALVAASVGSAWVAGVLAATAVLTKAQVVFVLPILAAVLVRTTRGVQPGRLAAAGAGAMVTSAIVVLPYLVRGAWANLTQALGRLAMHDSLSANNANIWWIFTWILRVNDVWGEWGGRRALTQNLRILAISRTIELGYPSPRAIGLVLVGAAIAWALWRARRPLTLAAAAALAGWCAYAYTVLAAQVHENHLYLAIPFFTIAAALDRRYRVPMWIVSAIFTVNLVLFYGLGRELPMPLDRGWTGIDMSVILACVNVVAFIWTTRVVARATRTQ
jgi:hypothetical protein